MPLNVKGDLKFVPNARNAFAVDVRRNEFCCEILDRCNREFSTRGQARPTHETHEWQKRVGRPSPIGILSSLAEIN
jgi:hypothetical protein